MLAGPAPTRAATVAHGRAALLDLVVTPSIAEGRRASYDVVLANRGTSEAHARLSVLPEDDRLHTTTAPASLVLGPGQSGRAVVLLRPRRPQLWRRERQHDVRLRVHGPDGTEVAGRRLVFVQLRPRVLRLAALLALVLAAAAVAAALLLDRVEVPPVEGASDVATAERALRAAGLRLDPRLRSRTTSAARPGTILDQIPAAGARVKERRAGVAARRRRRAPRRHAAVDGQTPARAATILRAAGLVAGRVLPDDASANSVVASQLPAAGARVPVGTAVTLFVRPARAGGAPAARGAGRAGGEPAKVPAIDGRNVTRVRERGRRGRPRPARRPDGEPRSRRDARRRPARAGGGRWRPATACDWSSRRARRSSHTTRASVVRLRPAPRPDRARGVAARGPGGRAVVVAERAQADVPRRPPAHARVGAPRRPRARRLRGLGEVRRRDVRAGARRRRARARPPHRRRRRPVLRPRRLRACCGRAARPTSAGTSAARSRGARAAASCSSSACGAGKPRQFGILRYRSAAPTPRTPPIGGASSPPTSPVGRGAIAARLLARRRSRSRLIANNGLRRFQLLVTSAGDLRDPTTRALPVGLRGRLAPRRARARRRPERRWCSRPVGQLVRVDPTPPRETLTVSSGGRHPSYQPLTYAGPKGVA